MAPALWNHLAAAGTISGRFCPRSSKRERPIVGFGKRRLPFAVSALNLLVSFSESFMAK